MIPLLFLKKLDGYVGESNAAEEGMPFFSVSSCCAVVTLPCSSPLAFTSGELASETWSWCRCVLIVVEEDICARWSCLQESASVHPMRSRITHAMASDADNTVNAPSGSNRGGPRRYHRRGRSGMIPSHEIEALG